MNLRNCLFFEALEPRLCLAVYWVDSVGDSLEPSTLRGAVYAASQTPEDDVVRIELDGKIALTDGEIAFNASNGGKITLVGNGAERVVVDAQGGGRIFSVAPGVEVEISGLTLTGGAADVGGAVANRGALTLNAVAITDCVATSYGGGVFNEGTLAIRDGAFSGNEATAGSGGAIANWGSASIFESNIEENVAYAKGGALWNAERGTVDARYSQFDGNVALTYCGGGVCNEGTLSLEYSTLRENVAVESFGGGAYSTGTLQIVNSLIVANRAEGGGASGVGGGLRVAYGSASAVSSTIAGNFATWEGGGAFVTGGEITLYNSIVAENYAASREDFYSATEALGSYNFIGADPLFAVGPNFDDLGTLTNADALDLRLTVDSQAVDAGNADFALTADDEPLLDDLNGAGYVRVRGSQVDVGAYEFYDVAELPVAIPAARKIVVGEGEYVYFDGVASIGDGLSYLWNLSGDADGVFEERPATFWASSNEIGGGALGDGVVYFKVRSADGRESLPIAISITIAETTPLVAVSRTTTSDGAFVRFAFDVASYGTRNAYEWRVDWGDGTSTTLSQLATSAVVAHCYKQSNFSKKYSIALTLADEVGGGRQHLGLGTQTVAAIPASFSRLNVRREPEASVLSELKNEEAAFATAEEYSVYKEPSSPIVNDAIGAALLLWKRENVFNNEVDHFFPTWTPTVKDDFQGVYSEVDLFFPTWTPCLDLENTTERERFWARAFEKWEFE